MKKLIEQKDLSVKVVYVTSNYSKTVEFNEKNYDEYSKVMKDLEQEFMAKAQTDDFWIDDVWIDGLDISGIDWKDFFEGRDRGFDPDKLELVFEGDVEEFAVKVQFLKNQGMDISDDNINEVIVFGESNRTVEGNFKAIYPEDFVDNFLEDYYPDLLQALEDSNSNSYFDGARLVSDVEANGGFHSDWIGDSFVYSYNR